MIGTIKSLTSWKSYAVSALAGAVLLSAALLGLRMYGKAQYADGYSQAQTEYRLAVAQAEQAARAKEQELQGEIENVRTEYQGIVDATAGAVAAARSESVGLQQRLAAANRRAAAEAARAGRALDENARIAGELRNVVGVCTAEYQRLGEVADGYRGDLIGLQGWARVVAAQSKQ